MMSVPSATCTVTGTPRRAPAARMLSLRYLRRVPANARPSPEPSAEAGGRGLADGAVQETSGLLGHAAASLAQTGADVLRRRARKGQLEVVHDAGAVHRHRRDDTALHQIDDQRPEADLDRVGAHAEHDATAGAACGRDRERPRHAARAPPGCREARRESARGSCRAAAASRASRARPDACARRGGNGGPSRDRVAPPSAWAASVGRTCSRRRARAGAQRRARAASYFPPP